MKKPVFKYFLVFLVLILTITFVIIFPKMGYFLIERDETGKADAAILLMGSIPDRVLQASDLYLSGAVDKIIIAESFMDGYEVLLQRGVSVKGDAAICAELAVELGVKQNDIIILPGNAKSTQDEAYIIRDYLKDQEISSVVVVTSSYHSKRAKMIFTKALKPFNIDVSASASVYDSFNADKWYKGREDAKKVLTEYLKLINFIVREQFLFN